MSVAAAVIWYSYTPEFREKLVQAFQAGDQYQRKQMVNDPEWKYVENFNREYARCKYHLTYSNTVSPIVHEEVRRRVGAA